MVRETIRGSQNESDGTPMRVVSSRTLSIGPISLERALTEATQNVEVTFQALGRDDNAVTVSLLWRFEDQWEDRFWMIFSRQLDAMPRYQYKVRLIVHANRRSGVSDWEDAEWHEGSGSGPLVVMMPTKASQDALYGNTTPGTANSPPALGSFGLSTLCGSGWVLRAPGIALKSDAPIPPSVAAN